MESRPFGSTRRTPPLAGLRQRSGPRTDLQGPGVGGLRAPYTGPSPVAPELQTPPLRPLQGLRARSAGSGPSSSSWGLAGWVPGITHPYHPPGYTRPIPPVGPSRQCPSPRCTSTPVAVTTGACTYGRFGHRVGEPRGLEYSPCFRVLAVFSTTLFLDVLHGIMTETGL